MSHYYGIEVAVERVDARAGPVHVWVRDLDPALVPHLVDDRAPAKALLVINGKELPFYRNGEGDLEAVFDLALLGGRRSNVTVTVWDDTGMELFHAGIGALARP